MLRNARTLEKFELRARDGKVGHVQDFFFDEHRWTIRYFVVNTGSWLNGREVLISPHVVHEPDWLNRVLPVDLTQAQVRESPLVDPQHLVSRDQEIMLLRHYAWPAYWMAPSPAGDLLPPRPEPATFVAEKFGAGAPHDAAHLLRSVRAVTGSRLMAADGAAGHVQDFLFDDRTWQIPDLVVSVGHVWARHHVLVPTAAVTGLAADEACVAVGLTAAVVAAGVPYASRDDSAGDAHRSSDADAGTAPSGRG